MDDLRLLGLALGWLEEGRQVALARVVTTWGSAPRQPGAVLVIDDEGRFEGSVSGGCVEGAVVTEAADVIASGKPQMLEFSVSDDTALAVGLACGGQITVLVEAIDGGKAKILRQIADAGKARKPAVLETLPDTGAWRLDLTGAAHEKALRRDRSAMTEGRFVQVFNPPLRLVISGAVHIAQCLCVMARLAGYLVTVIDPREGFANAQRFDAVDLVAEWPEDVLAQVELDRRTAVAALAHVPEIDDPVIAAGLAAGCFYVGALGSRRTHAGRLERLAARGIGKNDLARIHAPVGLDIGSEGVAEIAISIIAEITRTLRQER